MELIAEILVSAMLVVGGLFLLVGSFGLVKLDDLMKRLHAPTKASTLGVGGVLIGSMIWFAVFERAISVHELLVTLFIFLTAPITANMIAKAHLHLTGEKAFDLPETQSEEGWATFHAAPVAGPTAEKAEETGA
ncbi:MAG: Na+/H+ antiporter subunit G [Alphaproteobacteria bacterium]|jgi:multicomponent K+:H+ antiporter subunit G